MSARIVSLCPSTTETLIEFGARERLVGITRFCIHPAHAIEGLHRVGGTKTPDLEKIAAAEPTLIFMNEEENRAEDHAWLSARFAVDVSMPQAPEDVPALLRRWGRLVDADGPAEAAAAAIENGLTRLQAGPAEPVRFAYLIWRDPWMAAASGTYIDALLRWGGGVNAFDGPDRYPSFELDRLSERRPDRVLLATEPYPFKPRHVPEVQAAVPGVPVEIVDGDDASWHGVRTLRGLSLVERLFR